jgi:DNA polymerase
MGVMLDTNGSYFIDRNPHNAHLHIPAANLLAGAIIRCAHGFSTVHPEMDFECYSEAGYYFDPVLGRFKGVMKTKKGLKAVGSAAYALHPSTEILCLAYNLKDGLGPRLWYPGDEPPYDLIDHIENGGLIEAHNSLFEYFIWTYVCHKKMGWPAINLRQIRCSMSKAAAFALPASLDAVSSALQAPIQKDKEGHGLMLRLSQPRTPTQKDRSLRMTRACYPAEHGRLGQYCVNDTYAESEVSAMLPDLSPEELELWITDQTINARGVHIDKKALEDCISIVQQAFAKYADELKHICGGEYDEDGDWRWNVESPAELDNIKDFLKTQGIVTKSLDADHVAALLARDNLPSESRRVLEIREMLGASSVKKLFSLLHHLCPDERVRGLFAFCGADRTGRFAGRGPQPQNMPSSGPKLNRCDPIGGCGHHYQNSLNTCPWCGCDAAFSKPEEWSHEAVDQALKVIASRNLQYVEYYFGDPIAVISGCLRGLFVAAPGKVLLSSDYSAIEAVVLGELAGEEWRQEVFRTHGKIYEMGASKISGVPFEEIVDHKKRTGEHHPLRKKIGKVSELACFEGDTQVLTNNGFKKIKEVLLSDKVWDGDNWVSHQGVVSKGIKLTLNLYGVGVTKEHPIAIGANVWAPAEEVRRIQAARQDAFEYCRSRLPLKTLEWNSPSRKEDGRMVEVFDLVNTGPKHRFTIVTRKGLLLVHNSGYGGWIQAWKNFGADKFMSDAEIKKGILAWREASPNVVELWGGQWRKHPKKWEWTPDFHGLEGAAVLAIMNPGQAYTFRSLSYQCHGDVLYCRLPSGRLLAYHEPRLTQGYAPHKNPVWQISYRGKSEMGHGQWIRLDTYSGKLAENVTQAVARDILTFALVNLEKAGYPIVLHIHDEVVAEVDLAQIADGSRSIEGLEKIMSTMPSWAAGWPIKAAGGWVGHRYRKG